MVEINTTAARKHVGEFERYIQTIKEYSHALVLDLPYTKLPCQIVIHLVYFAALWLNSLPVALGYRTHTPPTRLSLVANLILKNTARPPLDPSMSKPTMIQPLPTLCALAHSLAYSLVILAINRAHTRSSTSTPVSLKKPIQSPPSPCWIWSSKLSKIGEHATKKKKKQSPSNFSIEKGSNTAGRTMILKMTRAFSNQILPILTSPPNFPAGAQFEH
jgi:hypothetical protein